MSIPQKIAKYLTRNAFFIKKANAFKVFFFEYNLSPKISDDLKYENNLKIKKY